jgi:hypothetical protein
MSRCSNVAWLLVLAALGCSRPAEERTRGDLEVGHAEGATFEVRVASGLAAIRALTRDQLALWLSAPQALPQHLSLQLGGSPWLGYSDSF